MWSADDGVFPLNDWPFVFTRIAGGRVAASVNGGFNFKFVEKQNKPNNFDEPGDKPSTIQTWFPPLENNKIYSSVLLAYGGISYLS